MYIVNKFLVSSVCILSSLDIFSFVCIVFTRFGKLGMHIVVIGYFLVSCELSSQGLVSSVCILPSLGIV